MFKPKYRILITSKCFPEDGVVGLGTQLISILNAVKTYLPPHVWYASDVEAVGENVKNQNLANIEMSLIGNDLQFIQYCSEIDQFIWGVFLCVDEQFSSQDILGIQLETEDKPFRSINSNGIIM